MKYRSTRDTDTLFDFEEVVIRGLAPDGGLFVPTTIPQVDSETLSRWRKASYNDIAAEVLNLFAGASLSKDEASEIVSNASSKFRNPDWVKIVDFDSLTLLELFHGPTYSFKDYAMVILGDLLGRFVKRRNRRGHVLVATSGDTGSAAMAGIASNPHIDCTVLLPENRVSEIQRRQMTCNGSENCRSVLVRGTFDDCQRLLKEALHIRKDLLAMNSVNFGRIVSQIIYYFYSVLRSKRLPVNICVPTGNFGNILSAWYAKQMNCPIKKLIIGSNINDILPRFAQSNDYRIQQVIPTISPSIDIQISSNFERLLWHLEMESVAKYFNRLNDYGDFQTTEATYEKFLNSFKAYSSTDSEVLNKAKVFYNTYNYLADPHTCVALCAADKFIAETHDENVLVVSTAHPAKFHDAYCDQFPNNIPKDLKHLLTATEKFVVIDPNLSHLLDYLDSVAL